MNIVTCSTNFSDDPLPPTSKQITPPFSVIHRRPPNKTPDSNSCQCGRQNRAAPQSEFGATKVGSRPSDTASTVPTGTAAPPPPPPPPPPYRLRPGSVHRGQAVFAWAAVEVSLSAAEVVRCVCVKGQQQFQWLLQAVEKPRCKMPRLTKSALFKCELKEKLDE